MINGTTTFAHAMKTKTDILREILPMVSALATIEGPEPSVREAIRPLASAMVVMIEHLIKLDEKVDAGFERVERTLVSLHEGLELLREDVGDLKRRVGKLEYTVSDIQEMLVELTHAYEKDAEATINHEARIARLEKVNNLHSLSPRHLRAFG